MAQKLPYNLLNGFMILFIVFITIGCEEISPIPKATLASRATNIPPAAPTVFITPASTLQGVACAPKGSLNNGNHIGLQIPQELDGIQSLDSLVIASDVGLSLMVDKHGQHLFWLQRSCVNRDGRRTSQVISELIVPALKDGEFATPTCIVTSEEDSRAVAKGYYQEENASGGASWKIIVTKAWYINSVDWSFEEISQENLEDVSCTYENW